MNIKYLQKPRWQWPFSCCSSDFWGAGKVNLNIFSSIRTRIAKYFGANWHCTHSLPITPTMHNNNNNNNISVIVLFRYDTFIYLNLVNDCEIRNNVSDLFIIAISWAYVYRITKWIMTGWYILYTHFSIPTKATLRLYLGVYKTNVAYITLQRVKPFLLCLLYYSIF